MNAYELANEAEKAFMTNNSQYFAMPLINLVRQQADRIAELERACKELQEESDQYFLKVCELEKWEKRWSEKSQRQADRIAELEDCINDCYTVQKMQAEEVYKGNAKITELEKESSKPVTWDSQEELECHICHKKGYPYPNCGHISYISQKPIAWMLNGKFHSSDPSDWAKEEYPNDDVIPLYTHPAIK